MNNEKSKRSKLTLIIDGNWLLMSRLSIMLGKYPNEADMMKDVKILMVKSINIVLKQFQYIDNIIFVADHGTWRLKVKTPDFLLSDGVEYKGNRQKDEEIDWAVIFNEYVDFINTLKEKGIQVSHEAEVEGDDWCWYWSNRLNEEGTNCIIWSRDRDLTQLVKRNDNGYFTVVWSKEAGLVMKDESDMVTSFLINPYYASNDAILNDIVQKSAKKTMIVPESVIIDKIIRGDAGDNVQPIILRTPKKASSDKVKFYKVTAKDLPEKINIFNDNEINEYIESIIESKNYKNRVTRSFDNIVEHFKYNRTLVTLHETSYPEYIKEIFRKYDEHIIDHLTNSMHDIEVELIAKKNEIKSILDEI